jgi:four helix bundle protein
MTCDTAQIRSYRDLIAWQKAIALVKDVYASTAGFPKSEIYGLTSQLRRASISIPSNIAEGHGRATSGEFIQFLCQARGSLCEVETQIVLAGELSYFSREKQQALLADTDLLGRLLNGLINSIQRKKLHRAKLVPNP